MNSNASVATVEPVLDRFDAVVDDVLALALDACTDEQVLTVWRRLETARRRLEVADHAVIGQAQSRHLDFALGAKNVADLARQVLRISPYEASRRVRAADAAGTRRSLTGELVPPSFPDVAAAQAAGEISAAQAQLVVATVDALPGAIQAELGATVEGLLVEQARELDPTCLAALAQGLSHRLDPDGRLTDAAYRQRRRDIGLQRHADGSGHLCGELTAENAEFLETMFDVLARPVPEADGAKDQRTPGQRRHDALLEAMRLLMRAELLPNAGGITATIILTATAADWADNTGTVTTGHGATIATEEAKRWIGDARMIGVLFDRTRAVLEYSTCQRIFTENQRLVLAGRDGGCAFPGCDAAPLHCEAHHLVEHRNGGETSIANGCLLCSYHHRTFEQMGWRGVMHEGRPHFIPPMWIDPLQKPRRNTMHDFAVDLPDENAGMHAPRALARC